MKFKIVVKLFIFACSIWLTHCNETKNKKETSVKSKDTTKKQSTRKKDKSCSAYNVEDTLKDKNYKKKSPEGMVWIPGGIFKMGTDSKAVFYDETPAHCVFVSGFWMDKTEVTNAEFKQFVEETGYVTTAEKKPDAEEIKKQLPPGTPAPSQDQLTAGSLVFQKTQGPVPLNNELRWWKWQKGADWRHPKGTGSSIKGKMDHPVVHISYKDAKAYCEWAGKRLPTEAEWEYAAKAGKKNNKYAWGNKKPSLTKKPKTNIWEGNFPYENKGKDGFIRTAPAKNYGANSFGLYDMSGNVWEWVHDWYRPDYYKKCNKKGLVKNPEGPESSYDPREPNVPKKVTRGGSFLCNNAYCKGYRTTSRMKTSPKTSLEHTGFRCVKSPEAVQD